MRAVLTRVKSASVAIDGTTVGQIGQGFLILLGIGPQDTEKEIEDELELAQNELLYFLIDLCIPKC